MFYDLNVPATNTVTPELTRTIHFLVELGYTTICLSHTLSGKLPTPLTNPLPTASAFSLPSTVNILRRATILISDPSTNLRLPQLSQHYDILALRPTTEKLLLQACQSLDADLISLDFSQRLPFHLKHKVVGLALSKGLCFEVCYSAGIADATARRNLIQNVQGLIRATRNGRGIVISSEAKKAVGLRAPHDVVNLACLWGLSPDKARDAVCGLAGKVVAQARMRRKSFKGVVEVISDGGIEKIQNEKKRKAKEAERDGKRAKSAEQQAQGGQAREGQQKSEKLTKVQRKAKAKAVSDVKGAASESAKT
ncbi:PHP domain-like protein [Ascodesmis nigricans]|uniref:PHP domain-like protein n=1 Tax=Ascodesmis nigricans TaxID=341454 RepID=A0A4S2N6C1_9PEZI|nr:PHP domain-like protein [Ascodesmis nigricans]